MEYSIQTKLASDSSQQSYRNQRRLEPRDFSRRECQIETAIKNGSTTIRNRDARKFINGKMVISSHTLSTYWLRYFVETGVLKLQEGSTVVYDINVDKFNELVNPNDIIL